MTRRRAVAGLTVMAIVLMPSARSIRAQAESGQLDPSFGIGGIVTTDFAMGNDAAEAVAIDANGGIIAVGNGRVDGFSVFAVARYTTQGQPDPSFGSQQNGRVVTDFAGTGSFGRAVALHTGGTILVAGMNAKPGDLVFETDIALVRYLPDGTLDPAFGNGGRTTTHVPPIEGPGSQDDAFAVLVQPDGRIIVVGMTDDLSDRNNDFVLVRYLENGTPDGTFGSGQPDVGIVTTDFDRGFDVPSTAALQPDGRIVVAGTTRSADASDTAVALARYNADGSLDTTFGTGGRVVANFSDDDDHASGIVLQANGSIVIAGSTVATVGQAASVDFLLAKYDSQGQLDPTFGTAGSTATDFDGGGDAASAVVLQPDGAIVVAGIAAIDGVTQFALARYTAHGHLDPTFDDDGLVSTDVGPGNDRANDLALQSDGRIVAVGARGSAAAGEPADFALARYLAVVTPPPAPHALRFYLHGTDIPGTAGGFTMNLTPGPSHTLAVDLLHAPSWFSDPTLTGTFGSDATFQLVRPCTLGLGVAVSYRLSKTGTNGGSEQVLGETSRPLGLCLGEERIPITVAGPVALTNQRLRLTISSAVSVHLDLRLGSGAYVEATSFTGTP